MAITREQMAADQDAFDAEFEQERAAPHQPSEDEVFGLGDEDQAGQATPAGNAGSTSAAKETPAASPPPSSPSSPDNALAQAQQVQDLQAWEQRLRQQQAELDARAAAMHTSNVQQQQQHEPSQPGDADSQAGDTGTDSGSDVGEDPARQLVEDFGQDFVDLVKKLVAQECKTALSDCMGDVPAKVDQLIAELTHDRQQNHFKAIAAAHEDFMDVVESSAFGTWQSAQPEGEQAAIARVIESGSAQEIIDLLTRFKQSQVAPVSHSGDSASHPPSTQGNTDEDWMTGDGDDMDDAALDAAEGVRSGGGLKLPTAPPASDDYSAAWDEF